MPRLETAGEFVQPLLGVRALSKRCGERLALDGVSMQLQGDWFATLLGPIGQALPLVAKVAWSYNPQRSFCALAKRPGPAR